MSGNVGVVCIDIFRLGYFLSVIGAEIVVSVKGKGIGLENKIGFYGAVGLVIAVIVKLHILLFKELFKSLIAVKLRCGWEFNVGMAVVGACDLTVVCYCNVDGIAFDGNVVYIAFKEECTGGFVMLDACFFVLPEIRFM